MSAVDLTDDELRAALAGVADGQSDATEYLQEAINRGFWPPAPRGARYLVSATLRFVPEAG